MIYILIFLAWNYSVVAEFNNKADCEFAGRGVIKLADGSKKDRFICVPKGKTMTTKSIPINHQVPYNNN